MTAGGQGAGKLASPVREEPTEKDPGKGTSSAVDFTREVPTGNGPAATPIPRPKAISRPAWMVWNAQ